MRQAFVIINHKSNSAVRRCSCDKKSSFYRRLVSNKRYHISREIARGSG